MSRSRPGLTPRQLAYGMGAAVADYNDGYPDLDLSGYPHGCSTRSNGNGTFRDVTARAWRSPTAASGALRLPGLDFDQDGRLDPFVANYARFSFADARRGEFEGHPAHCAQTAYSKAVLRASFATWATARLPMSVPPPASPRCRAGRWG
jgi:hypothetical protein